MLYRNLQTASYHLEVCHRLYDVTNLVVISNVRKIGFYDMEAECIVEKDEDID